VSSSATIPSVTENDSLDPHNSPVVGKPDEGSAMLYSLLGPAINHRNIFGSSRCQEPWCPRAARAGTPESRGRV